MSRELLMQNNYEWVTAEGQTLEIENAIRSNARDLKIEGQTYQNLIDFTTQESTQGITFDQENSIITFVGATGRIILGLKNFKSNTKYTLITNVLNIPSNPNSPIRINNDGTDYNYNILNCLCTSLGINKVTFTTPSDISNLKLILYNNGRNIDYKFTFPIIIEGDYTNTDLPTSINGIESVAEREFEQNLYTEGDLNVKGKTAWLIVRKTVAVKPNTKYKISLDIESISKGSNNYSPNVEFYFNKKVNDNFVDKLLDSGSLTLTTKEDTTTLIFAFVINGKTVSTTDCEANFKNIELYESNVYPVTIAQSHNETDGITLPNGVKNTIENGEHIKRIGKYTITGNEYYELRNENDSMFKIQCSGLSIEPTFGDYVSSDVKMICDKAKCEFCGDLSYINNSLIVCGRALEFKGFIIAIPKSLLSEYTIDKAKEYIKSLGGMTVWYQLATPITEPITLTEIPLPQPLRSLPNGVCDEVVGNKLIQRIGKYTITGNEGYELRYQNDALFTIQNGGLSIEPTFNDFGNSDVKMICDKAVCKRCIDTTFITDKLTVCGRSSIAKGFVIAIPKSLLTEYTIDKAKEYIQSLGGMTVYYELATPIEQPINVSRVSIAKGSNIITTTNNIKPNLSIKYKKAKRKSTPKPPTSTYLYNAGNEYLNITGGWNTQLTASYGNPTAISKNTDNIYFPTGVWNMLLTNNKIDVTNYDVVYMKYSKEYNPYNFHPARCAIKLGNKNTSWTDFADDATTGALIGKDETENNVTNGILTIDVSNVTGSYYVGVGGQSNNITVHEIGLKKGNSDTTTLYSNGNENIVLTGGYLTNTNNPTSCNIEKQFDNLYVNCTGKSNFDSICYARTNKTIKPCKIKVSVKNNSISAKGIAFCVFLSEKEAINSVSDFNSVVNKGYIKASNTTQGQYVDLEIDLTNNARGYLYIACMIAGSTYVCKANINKIKII